MAGRFLPSAAHRRNRVLSILRLVGAVTAVAVMAASCGDDDDKAETATESPPSDESYEADVDAEPPTGDESYEADVDAEPPTGDESYEPNVDAGCPVDHPTRLKVTTSYPDEVQYLDDITVCTTPAQEATLIVNASDAVWKINTTGGGADVDQLTNNLRLSSFRELAQTVYPHALLAPHSQVVVHAEPFRVEWLLAPDFTAAWLTHDRFVKAGESYFQGFVVNAIAGRSPWRQAVATCALVAYNQTGPFGQLLASDNPGEQLFLTLGIVKSGTKCGKAIQQADDDAARVAKNKVTTLTDELAGWLDDAEFLRYADDQLTLLKRLGLRQLLPRIIARRA